MRFGDILVRLQDTTAEIRVRIAVLLLVAFVAMAERFGLETILGAFIAGGVLSLIDRDSMTHPHFRLKLEAIGYGFVVPVFFVTSGLRFDLGASCTARRRSPESRCSCSPCSWCEAFPLPCIDGRSVHEGDRGRIAAGHVAPVHRHRHRDRRRARLDPTGQRRRAGRRRLAVGHRLPTDCPRAPPPR